ncbi:hypothetical protein D1B31_05030 [Neobacillus notoginsengisoli]|uniref:Uncharacterized protein n=1 Tax=Neobacillus notoginsengisoli TaxID=1578198 RepID=A0A417YWZ5_9BACI|nr:hypothetical protein [Neobacillus notoginsengisoli]RHW42010.1 hypothetical protein D1B31_05030 [Neobacillus notoginsengisoli]
MKKYILPLAILMVSVFFLNQAIEPKEKKEPAKEANTIPIPDIMSYFSKEKTNLIRKSDSKRKLTDKEINKAANKVKPLEVNPYEIITFAFFPDEKPDLSVTEWDAKTGEERIPVDNGYFGFVYPSGLKTILVRAKWNDGKAAIYVAKVHVNKMYSYQELLSANLNHFTVMGFFDSQAHKREMPTKVESLYDISQREGTLESLKVDYPELDIRKLPAYYIFQYGKPFFVTNDSEELKTYLNQEKVLIFEGKSENWEAQLAIYQKLGNGKLHLTIRYIKNEDKPVEPFTFFITGPSSLRVEGTLDVNEREIADMLVPMDVHVSENDSITCKIIFAGKEEEIILKYMNDGN